MRNQTKRVFTHKSKVFLTILCMLGLVFSWSCSCKNRVSDPNNIPPDNGIKTNDIINPDTDNRTNGGAVSGSYQIVVASAGDTVSTTATVKFLNATGTLTAIADVDASANTTLAVDDFDYTGTTLTFKKDTTDASKIDTTVKDKITWAGTETRKVKATFSLTPTATNVDLTTTTQDVEIEIKKIQKFENNNFGDFLKQLEKISVGDAKNLAEFKTASGTYSAGTFTIENGSSDNATTISKSDLGNNLAYFYNNQPNKKGYTKAELVIGSEAGGGDNDNFYSVKIKFTYDSDNYEITEQDTITFKFVKKNSAKWVS